MNVGNCSESFCVSCQLPATGRQLNVQCCREEKKTVEGSHRSIRSYIAPAFQSRPVSHRSYEHDAGHFIGRVRIDDDKVSEQAPRTGRGGGSIAQSSTFR